MYVCAGLSEPLLIAHATLLEISCRGSYIKRICHECEVGIEKSVRSITVWHREACRVMTNYDPEG